MKAVTDAEITSRQRVQISQMAQAIEHHIGETSRLQAELDRCKAMLASTRAELERMIVEQDRTPTRAAAPPQAGSRVAPPAGVIGVAGAGKSGPPVEERPPVRSGAAPGPSP